MITATLSASQRLQIARAVRETHPGAADLFPDATLGTVR
jgi:hypothetical protein